MKNLRNKLKEKVSENKITKKCIALLLALSMTVGFVVPYEEVFESAITTALAAGKEDAVNNVEFVGNVPAGNIITEAYDHVPAGAYNFGDKLDIEKCSFDIGTDGGSGASVPATLTLSYRFDSNPGLSAGGDRYLYYQLPEGMKPLEVIQGASNQVDDTSWNPTGTSETGKVPGWYSISENGLIVIKLTDFYIRDKIKNGGFTGSIGFSGTLSRNSTASGDQKVNIGGKEITVTFDDVIKEDSKDSRVIKDDATGDMLIHYTITVKNPAKNVDFTKYNFNDIMTYTDKNGNTQNCSGQKLNIKSNPAGCIDAYGNFTGDAKNQTSFTIEYDYKPTSDEIKSMSSIKNDAEIVNKENSEDKATTSHETPDIDDYIKAKIVKNGETSYNKYDETGFIEWTIDVERNYNLSLKDYVITDEAFKGIDDSAIQSVKDKNGNDVNYDIDKTNGKITITGDTDNVTITYRTYKDDDGNLLEGQKTEKPVHNAASVTPPGGDEPDNEDNDNEVKYSESSSVVKTGSSIENLEGYNKLEGKPESDTKELEWTVKISDFSGIHTDKSYTDTLTDSPDKQWFTQEQINNISIAELDKSQYTVVPTGENGKYTGFTINFNSNDTSKRKLTITYQSTIETKDIANNSSYTFKNNGNYDNHDDPGEVTVSRGDNTHLSGEKWFETNKSWDNVPDNIKPENIWVKLQYRLEDENTWHDYPVIAGEVDENPKKLGKYINEWNQTSYNWQIKWNKLPQKCDDKTYYYRVIEVDENGNEIESTENYTPSYSVESWATGANEFDYNNGYNATQNAGQLNVTNTYNKFDATVSKDWKSAPTNEARPTVTFTLWKRVGEDGEWINTGKTETLTNGIISVTFKELPKIENGKTVYYEVRENPVTDYTTTYPSTLISKDNTSWTVTNTYDRMAINAKKEWVGDAGSEDNRPSTGINIKLQYATVDNPTNGDWKDWGSEDWTNEYNISGTHTLTAADNWLYTWEKLPRKDKNGNIIHYQIRETTSLTNYDPNYDTYVSSPTDKYDVDYEIRNVYKNINIKPEKQWVGDKPSDRSETIEFKLQYRTEDSGWEDYSTIDSTKTNIIINVDRTVGADDTDTAASSWLELPKEKDGKKCYYRAVEVNGDSKYVSSFGTELDATGNSIVTNTYDSIDITPAKSWVGDEGHETDRGESITLKLQWRYAGDSAWNDTIQNVVAPVGQKGTITLKSNNVNSENPNEWIDNTDNGKWSGLPKTNVVDGERKTIQYQVVEVTENANYTASASSITSNTNKLTVTNTYNYFKITASKTWDKDTANDRPEKITLYIEQSTDNTTWTKVDNTEQEFNVTGDMSNLTHESWSKLPKKDTDGKTIYYRVVESPVKGYKASCEPETISNKSGNIAIKNTKLDKYGKTAIGVYKDNISNIKDGSNVLDFEEITNISKNDISKIPEDGDYYIFTYKVSIPKGTNQKYIDTLPDNAVYKDNSFYVCFDFGNDGHKMYTPNANQASIEYNANKHEIVFTTASAGDAGNIVGFVYHIKVPKNIVDDAVAANGYYTLSNNIKREGDNDEGVTAELTIGSKAEVPGEKENITKEYDTGNARNDALNARARYIIEINPDGKKLSNEDYIDLSDLFEITGYQVPGTPVRDANGKITSINRDGQKYEGTGLLDATIHDIVIEDMNNLDSNGNPQKITDYVYIPEYNKETSEKFETTYNFSKYDNDGNKWRNSVKPGEKITLTINSNALSKDITTGQVYLYFKDSSGSSNLHEENIVFKTDDKGNATITIDVPKDDEIGMLEFNVWYGDLSKQITGITGVSERTVTTVDSAAMSFKVPDEKHLRITYYYSLTVNSKTPGTDVNGNSINIGDKPPAGSVVYFKNKASINTSNGSETSETDEKNFQIITSSAVIATDDIPTLEKVDIGNYATNDLDATFKLAKYKEGKWVYATEFNYENTQNNDGTISSLARVGYGDETVTEINGVINSGSADLSITENQGISLESNVLYKIVEVNSPEGYVQTPYTNGTNVNSAEMKDFVFYFVYNGNANAENFRTVVDGEVFGGAASKKEIMQISGDGVIQIPNVNKIDISASKTWAQIPETGEVEATFTLCYSKKRSSTIPTGDDLTEVSSKTVTFINGVTTDEIKWTNLVNGKDGKPIYYYVKETSYKINGKTYVLQDDGTYKAADGTVGEYKALYAGNALSKSGEVKITNTKGLYVQKEWKNSDNTSMLNAPVDSINFLLEGKTANGTWETIKYTETEELWTLSKSSNPAWQINIPNDKLANYVDFRVTEKLTTEQGVTLYGYVVSYIKNLNGNSGVLEISNKNPYATNTNFTVNKKWADGLAEHNQEIKVTLYQTTETWADYTPTEAEKNAAKEIGEITLKAGKWSHTWENLVNLQENGKPYYYYAVEENVPEGFTASYTKGGTSSVQIETITNTPEEVAGKLSVQKKWEKATEEEITLNLYRRKKALTTNQYNIPEDITVSCIGDSITKGEMNNGIYPDGTYPKTLAELLGVNTSKVANQGENNRLIQALHEGDYTRLNWTSEERAKVICLIIGTNNILHPESDTTGKTKITQLKEYINSIKTSDNIIFVGSIPDGRNAVGTAGLNWMEGKDDIQYNADVKTYNTEIENLIKELNNNNIRFVDINSVVNKDTMLADGVHPNADGYTAIANKFYEAIGNYYGKKSTVDTSNVEVDINSVPTDLTESEKVGTIKLNSTNGWTWDSTTADLSNNNKFTWSITPESTLATEVTEDGVKYQWIYYIEEVKPDGNSWEVTYQHNGQPANGQMAITVTNTGDEETPKRPLKVEKVWSGSNTHPDKITVQLYSDTSENGQFTTRIGSPVELSAPDWSYTWEDVCEEGRYYKVIETAINGWKSESEIVKLTADSTKENPITITLTNTLETGSLQVEKDWSGEANADSVQVELYRVAVDENGSPISNTTGQTGNAENARTYNFSSENGMFSLSRFKRAVAEIETQSSESKTTEKTTETKSSGSLSKAKSNVSAKTTDNPFVLLPINQDSGSKYYDMPVSELTGKEITSIEAVFNSDNFNANIYFNFHNNGSEWSGNKAGNIESLNDNNIYSFDKSCSNYNKLFIQYYFNNSGITLTEVRFYYQPTGPQISFEKPTGNTAVVGDTVTLSPTITGNHDSLIYSIIEGSENATVNNNGKVIFNGAGAVKIKATASQGTNSNEATIEYTVEDFKITKKPNSITEGNEFEISKFGTNATGEIDWSSSDDNILKYEGGKFKAVGSGDVTITATRQGTNITATANYDVSSKPFDVTVEGGRTTLHVGGTVQLTASESGITWSSDDTSVATVDENGLVTAVGDGTATITATRSGKEVSTEITVQTMKISYSGDNTTEINISKNINENETINIVGAIGDIQGESEDTSIATVSGTTITVTAKEKQSTKITFTDSEGASVVVNVRINEIKEVTADIPVGADKVTDVGTNGIITISKDNNWKSNIIENLPLTDGNGNYYQYYIKEVKNDKYIPISYSNNGTQLNTENKTDIKLTNKPNETSGGIELPETGGMGTEPYTAVGLSLVVMSAAIMYIRRRKRKNA